MNLLVLASNYPHSGHPFSGIFNEKCARTLNEFCGAVKVLAPRPLVPPLLSSFVPRWNAYARAIKYESRNGIEVYRPATLVVPRFGGALWVDRFAFLCSRRIARHMHARAKFSAILSFDLIGAGGIAWRIGRYLGVPAAGWATGDDVRVPASSPYGHVVLRALERLDVVFYQSHELLEKAAELLGIAPEQMSRDRHHVLPRGISEPPSLPNGEIRKRIRQEWKISDDDVLILSIGRISREKGVYDLLEIVSRAAQRNPKIACLIVGSFPAFDETAAVQKQLDETPTLKRVTLLPACKPEQVWEFLCAADIFAFTSHNEGMPNSLLEAMAMGVPAIAFGIPPVLELEAGMGALFSIPPFHPGAFAEAILRLAASRPERDRIGKIGKTRVIDRYMVRKNMAAALDYLSQSKLATLTH